MIRESHLGPFLKRQGQILMSMMVRHSYMVSLIAMRRSMIEIETRQELQVIFLTMKLKTMGLDIVGIGKDK